jgi:hypothetical protein
LRCSRSSERRPSAAESTAGSAASSSWTTSTEGRRRSGALRHRGDDKGCRRPSRPSGLSRARRAAFDVRMRLSDPLNERQLQVLRWIGEGCPAGFLEGSSYKRTAAALQDRKLVIVSRRGGGWSATLTDAGRHYLVHGVHPVPIGTRSSPLGVGRRGSTGAAWPDPDGETAVDGGPALRPRSAASRSARKLSATEQFVADIVAAGGALEVPRESGDDGLDRPRARGGQAVARHARRVRRINRSRERAAGRAARAFRQPPAAPCRSPAVQAASAVGTCLSAVARPAPPRAPAAARTV